VCVPQVTAGDPQESRRRARPQAYTDDRDARFEDLDRWTRPRAPDIDSTAEPMHKMNPTIRRRAMAIPIALSANVLHPHAPHKPTEPCGWRKLKEPGPRAVVYKWIRHQAMRPVGMSVSGNVRVRSGCGVVGCMDGLRHAGWAGS
jgi:hypothetical protein